MKEFIKNILSFTQPGKYNNEECIYINNYFVLVKDLKMKTDNIDNLHFTAWCKNTNIHSLKDLKCIQSIRGYGFLGGIDIQMREKPGKAGFQVYKECYKAGLNIKPTGDA